MSREKVMSAMTSQRHHGWKYGVGILILSEKMLTPRPGAHVDVWDCQGTTRYGLITF
jgi:hypothetical protein